MSDREFYRMIQRMKRYYALSQHSAQRLLEQILVRLDH